MFYIKKIVYLIKNNRNSEHQLLQCNEHDKINDVLKANIKKITKNKFDTKVMSTWDTLCPVLGDGFKAMLLCH